MTAAGLIRAARPLRWARPAGYVLLVLALVYLGAQTWSLLKTRGGEEHDLAAQRDELTRVARADVALLNSVDPKRADLDMGHWVEVSTGPFHDALQADLANARQIFSKQKSVARGDVTALAITKLDAASGNATLLASVRIFMSPKAGDPATTEQRKRYEVGMQRVSGTWKVNSLTALTPTAGTAGPKAAPTPHRTTHPKTSPKTTRKATREGGR
ncbi:hypothetical protein [Actinomadura atramentaria]|uniref:hypothetical protein n=1 Tax=Actinomadura atramentaria TaxID=1990 RepID=UPI0003737581|nr:hypothetical protein [Actinomadura atramentaria]